MAIFRRRNEGAPLTPDTSAAADNALAVTEAHAHLEHVPGVL